MIAKLHSLNSIQLLILTKLNLLMFTFEPIQNLYRVQSNLFDCTIIAMFPILYFRYYISDTLLLLLLSLLLLYYILLYYHMLLLLLLLLGFNLILLLPISLYTISIISWLYCMRSSSYSYRIVH